MREFPLSSAMKYQALVKVATKTGKKPQGENNDQGKRKIIRPTDKVFNQYASKTDGDDSEFDRESQTV